MKQARIIVSINSKSGAEALLLGKPVLVLGKAFYSDCPYVQRLDQLADLPSALAQPGHAGGSQVEIARYFQNVYDQTFRGELYACNSDNITDLADTIMKIANFSVQVDVKENAGMEQEM